MEIHQNFILIERTYTGIRDGHFIHMPGMWYALFPCVPPFDVGVAQYRRYAQEGETSDAVLVGERMWRVVEG